MRAESGLIRALISNRDIQRELWEVKCEKLFWGGGRLLAAEKLIKIYVLQPIQ